MAEEIPSCPQAAMKYSVFFFQCFFYCLQVEAPGDHHRVFFLQSGISTLTDRPSRSPQFGSSSPPGDDASCVNHSQADAWLFSSSACTLVFFIKGQSVIITPPDYYCFYTMMDSPKRQHGIWDVVFLPSLLVRLSGDEGFIYVMLRLSCQAARRLPLVSRSIWNQLMCVIWMQLVVNKAIL